MNRDQEPLKHEEKSWGDAQGSHSGIPLDDENKGVAGDPSPDDEIIELVDVVRKGDNLPDSEVDELAPLFDQAEEIQKAPSFMEREDEDLDEFSLPLDELAEEDLESGLDEGDHGPSERFEAPNFDFESPEDFVEQAEGDLTGGIPDEDLDEVMAGLADEVEGETAEHEPLQEKPPSVYPERLEASITQAVTAVVERVVRETVAEVAERVINEAIESLKQSLESTSE